MAAARFHVSIKLSSMPTLFVRLLGLVAMLLASVLHAQNVGLVRNAPVLKSGQTLGDLVFEPGAAPVTIDLGSKLEYPAAGADYARIQTPLGDIYLEFLTADAPNTVANFKTYLANESTTAADKPKTFDGTFVHRAVPGFVIQTGGYQALSGLPEIPTRIDPDGNPITVANEFMAANTRGTVAMAKLPDDPDSATHEWFFNLADNRAILDNQNGGFTAFARVLGNGMAVVDRIAALNQLDLYNEQPDAFDNLPYYNVQQGQNQIELFNLFPLNTVRSVPANAVPAALRGAPAITTTVVSPALASVAKVVLAKNSLTVTPGKFGGRFPVTVRASVGNGIFNDFTFDIIKNGPPGILSNLPAQTTQYIGSRATLLVDIIAHPAAGVVWERKPRGASVFSMVTPSELFAFTEAGNLVVKLDTADTAAALELSDSQFRYRTANPFGAVTSSVTTLRVVSKKLSLATNETLALPGLGAKENRAYSSADLPKGLVLDAITGDLSGTPIAKPGLYKFAVTMRDAGAVVGTRVYYVEIIPLSGNNVGGFEMFLSPGGNSAPPYAKLSLLVATDGTFSGNLSTTAETAPLPFKGIIVRDPVTGSLSLATPLTLIRPGAPAGRRYVLNFGVTPAGVFSGYLAAKASATAEQVDVAATDENNLPGVQLGVFSRSSLPPWGAATTTYTAAFTSPVTLDGRPSPTPVPEGSGYAVATLTVDGNLTFKGKTADGLPLTAALAAGEDASYRLFVRNQHGGAPGACLAANLPLTPASAPVFGGNGATYTRYSVAAADRQDAYWSKPAIATSTNYRSGFGPLGLTIRLEPWNPSDFRQFGVATTSDPAKGKTVFGIGEDMLSNASPNSAGLPTDVSVAYGVIANYAKTTSPDANAFVAKLTTANGMFTGQLVLPTPAPARTVKFEGVYLLGSAETPAAGTIMAEGFGLVPAVSGAPVTTPSSVRVRFAQPQAATN